MSVKFKLCTCPWNVPHGTFLGAPGYEHTLMMSQLQVKKVLVKLFLKRVITASEMAEIAESEAVKTLPEEFNFGEDEEE